MSNTTVSILTVCYNDREFLQDFFTSLLSVDKPNVELEIIMIDNGSSDDSVALVQESFGQVTVLKNHQNNYAGALNLGIAHARGDYVAVVNNDTMVQPQWLTELLKAFDSNSRIGVVQSKPPSSNTGVADNVISEEVEHFHFRDIDMGEAESGQRDGGPVMFRRECLADVGKWDEEFILLMEDVDYSARCRKNGWKLLYSPVSTCYRTRQTDTANELHTYFLARNRLLFAAKHCPDKLSSLITSSHFCREQEYDNLYRILLQCVRAIAQQYDAEIMSHTLSSLKAPLLEALGETSTYTFYSQLQVVLGLRTIRVGIYDHAGHFAGGGQRYVAEMAAELQKRYEVTYIFNNDVTLDKYREWFDLDLSDCNMKVIKIPFFEERHTYTPNEAAVLSEQHNVFDIISRESLKYDIFINANMLSKVNPLSARSIFMCHFPDQEKTRFFQVHKYDHLITNSDYTGEWVRKRWRMEPTRKLYPPVNMFNPASGPEKKEKIILSVSRFESSGSKKQLEMVKNFSKIQKADPETTQGWKLVLIGGSSPENTYLEKVKKEASKSPGVEIRPNASVEDIKDMYRRAAIFWHACGLDETKPERVEHFGMTTVESMQNYCVPIVIDGGGQREIVQPGESGYRFSTLEELSTYSLRVMGDQAEQQRLAVNAYDRSMLFSREVFTGKLNILLEEIEDDLMAYEALPEPC